MDCAFNTANVPPTFWSGTHLGRKIATSRHNDGWVVYIDLVMQANRTFAGIEDAIRWLQRKVDDADFDSRAAALCKRRAARPTSARPWAA